MYMRSLPQMTFSRGTLLSIAAALLISGCARPEPPSIDELIAQGQTSHRHETCGRYDPCSTGATALDI